MSVPNPSTVDWVPLWPTGPSVPSQPACCLFHSVNFTAPNGFSNIPFDTEVYDTDNMHAPGNSFMTIRTPGLYYIWARQFWTVTAAGTSRELFIQDSAGVRIFDHYIPPSTPQSHFNFGWAVRQYNAGDTLTHYAYQDSGANQTITTNGSHSPMFGAFLIGGMSPPQSPTLPVPINGQWLKAAGGGAIWAPLTEAAGLGNKHAIPLINGWANYGSGYPPAMYWKDAMGMVHLEGLISQSVQNGTVAVMPVGYRPAAPTGTSSVMFPATSNGPPGPTGLVLVDLRVQADGTITCSGAFGSGWLSLASVHYDSGSPL